MSKQPVLFVFSGLPGVGKTTISKKIAILYKAVYFRIDTIEHGIEELCSFKVQGEGYRLTYRIAKDNLALGNNVVVDCCNPYQFVRKEWKDMALRSGARCIDIEIKCSDKKEHKTRIKNRENDIEGFILPTWEEVEKREFERWEGDVIRIETAGRSREECIEELKDELEKEIGYFA